MQDKLNIAVFVDYDNIEIGLKSTLRREFDVGLALEALKERGDIVAKRGHGLDDRAVERPGNQQEMGGVRRIAAGPQTGDVMRQELLELVLLLFVPGDADAKRRPEAHGILFLAFEAAQARDPGALVSRALLAAITVK